MKLERNCQLRSVRDVECGSALWKNHNWRKYNFCHSVMWPRSFAGQWWRYKSTKVAQEALVAPFTDTVSSLFCWTIPPALIYSHDVGSCLDSCPSGLSSGERGNKAKQCTMLLLLKKSGNRTIYQNVYLAPHFFPARLFQSHEQSWPY